MQQSLSISELFAAHAVLSTEVAALDRRIQALSTPSPEIAEADVLWMELEDVLSRESAIVAALIDQAASNAGELRHKGQVLATLLQSNRLAGNDLAQALSLSLVRDIITLFP